MNHLSSNRYVRIIATLAVMLSAAAVVVGFAQGRERNSRANDRVENSDAAIAFREDMRKLWEDHVTWTRLVIISFADDLDDRDAAVNRLLHNQVDIGDAVKPYYGDAAGAALTGLLQEHIAVAAEILTAAKANDGAAVDEATARWRANGDEIAAFLNSANPGQWPLAHMQQMMQEHLDLTLNEAVARLNGNYEADVAAYDAVHDAILEMADMLSLGIIHQFPKKFR
jgi:hypothetical protein